MNEEFRAKDGFKICKDCLEKKTVHDFYVRKGNSDGYLHICRVCDQIRKRGKSGTKKTTAARKNPFSIFSFRNCRK